MNTSAKGRTREHRTMKMMRESGYSCLRAAASKGEGGVDIVFWKKWERPRTHVWGGYVGSGSEVKSANAKVTHVWGTWGVAQVKSANAKVKIPTLAKQASKLAGSIKKAGRFPIGTIVQVWIWQDRKGPIIESVVV